MKFLRTINKLITGDGLSLNFTRWKIGADTLTNDVDVLFPDGIISINSLSKAVISKFQSEHKAVLADYSVDLIAKYNLVDGDIFLGRDSNYLLFREGSLSIESDQLNIDCNDVNITVANSITVNGIELTFVADKMLINGAEIAVVGGDVNPTTHKIEISGQ